MESLEALFVANPDFDAIEKAQDVFCPFEAIGMIRQEIRHAYFLAYTLDPQRPHGFGAECFRALMRTAAYAHKAARSPDSVDNTISPLAVHLMDFEKAQIRREWKRIDLLSIIEEEKLVVAIELKIDANERIGQLSSYRQQVEGNWPVEKGWRHLFLFLTKNGDDASDADGEGWTALHLADVAKEFEQVARKGIGHPDALILLKSYLSMLRRHHLNDDELDALAAKLWAQHKEALDFLMARRPNAGSGAFSLFHERRDEVARRMSAASGFEVVPDDSAPSIIRFAVKAWDKFPDFNSAEDWTASKRLILIEMQREAGGEQFRIRFVLGSGSQHIRHKYHERLLAAGLPASSRKKITPQWTRLATRTITLSEDSESQSFDYALGAVEDFAREMIPPYTAALAEI